jgi:hypothetical protein
LSGSAADSFLHIIDPPSAAADGNFGPAVLLGSEFGRAALYLVDVQLSVPHQALDEGR